MPKEIAHMSVAHRLRRDLSSDSVFHDPIHKFSNLYLYGSVAPDTCFFYLAGPGVSSVRRVSQIFHQPDVSTVVPILKLLKKNTAGSPEALAFAAGLLCHLITDTVFHPMVFYFSGSDDLHSGATMRHRMFETAMDLHFRSMLGFSAALRPPQVLSHIEISGSRLSDLLQNLFSPETAGAQKKMSYAFRSHWLANQLFLRGQLFKGLAVFNIAPPPIYRVLCYPCNHPVELGFFRQGLSYKDPETGDDYTQTLADLVRQSVKQCIVLLSMIETWLLSDETPEDLVSNSDLPLIRPCPPLDEARFKYWYGPCDFEKMLYGDLRV